MRIIAIGGGELGSGETMSIDRHSVKLTGKDRPRALFIPTASSDDPEYIETFSRVYGHQLGCEVGALRLLAAPPSHDEIADLIRAADLIYVGGGNTLKMMRRWRRLGVDQMLLTAAARGTILCGLSAGELCWFHYGHSDSMSFYHPDDWEYIRVKCLGLLPFTACPHYDGEGRHKTFQTMIERDGGIGIALDDCAAFEVHDDQFRILTSRNGANAYRVAKVRGEIVQSPIPVAPEFTPIAALSNA